MQHLAAADIGWGIPGLGGWSSDDTVKLLRTGTRPDGREAAGIMNWRAYGQMSDTDVQAVAAYLKSIPPVTHAVTHAVAGPTAMADVKAPYFSVAKPERPKSLPDPGYPPFSVAIRRRGFPR